ncbi:MAG: hypothetical protein ABI707_20455, partial [Ferruginibacter sp.]
MDQVLAVAKEGKYYTFLNKEDIEKQLPSIIRKKFEGYAQMAGLTVDEIFGDRLNSMNRLNANTLSSGILWNSGKNFIIEKMPDPIQWFPVFAWCVADFNGDGKKDVLAAGNFYGVTPYEGRYDAGYGQVLINKNKSWATLSPLESGLKLEGEIRSVQRLRTKNKQWIYLVARNNDKLMVFEPVRK